MSFQRVARASEVPEGRGLCVRVGGIDVGLFRVGDRIHAMENRCPHAGDPLSEGRLEGPVVVCGSHGWSFDVRTGFRPDDGDGFPIPCFAVRVDGGEIYVDLADCVNMPRRRRAKDPGEP